MKYFALIFKYPIDDGARYKVHVFTISRRDECQYFRNTTRQFTDKQFINRTDFHDISTFNMPYWEVSIWILQPMNK